MNHRIGMAIVCLHVSAILYFIIGILMLPLFSMNNEIGEGVGFMIAIAMFVFSLALIVGIEIVVYGLKQRKYWAWIAGICIFAIYVPSLFLPLGAFGLWGLLDPGSQAAFRNRVRS